MVPYTADQMFALVDDVNAYPDFLPWCKSAKELSRNEDEVRATLEVSRGGLHKSFTTCNRLQKHKMIEMRLVEGPFHHLDGFWRFENIGESTGQDVCKVTLDLDFEFSSKILQITLGPIFNQIVNTLVNSFCDRAVVMYGKQKKD